jgi:hypothetical protein
MRRRRHVLPTVYPAFVCLALAAGPNPAYWIKPGAERNIEAELTFSHRYSANFMATEWNIFAASPPELPGQTKVQAALEPGGQMDVESSPLRRTVLSARLTPKMGPFAQQFTAKVRYQATLRARQMLPLRPGDRPPAAPVLTAAEEKAGLASSALCNFDSTEFKKWLDDRKLRRAATEDEVEFGRRAFLAVSRGYAYDYKPAQDRHVSKLATAKETDCGGMCLLFVGAMRANGIPARVLAGRWAMSARPGEQLNGVAYYQYHVKAEFFVRGVGWVPVDLASGRLHDKSKEGLLYFGNDPGDFLTMHIDTDLVVETTRFGKKTLSFMQGVHFWVAGKPGDERGTSEESWLVKK